ncbi:MAG: hypothetical protein V4813_16840 [Gemmatimonadota bacterium]
MLLTTTLLASCSDGGTPLQPEGPSLNVKQATPTVTITSGPTEMQVGTTAIFAATATDARGRTVPPSKIHWYTDDPSVLQVQGAAVTARKPGRAIVYAAYGRAVAKRTVVVDAAPTFLLLAYRLTTEPLDRVSILESGGGQETLIEALGVGYHHFDLSPDRTRLVFAKPFDNRVFVAAANGTDITAVVQSNINYLPRYSSDGSRVVWTREVGFGAGSREIFIMNADGSNQTRLTDVGGEDNAPGFSGDGTQIVFQSNRSGNYEIWTMNVDGSNPVALTTDPSVDAGADWSPDSRSIAFLSNRSGAMQLYTMASDGSNVRQLTTTSVRGDVRATWSPDGKRIAVARDEGGQGVTWLINADGTGEVRLRIPDATRSFEYVNAWRK